MGDNLEFHKMTFCGLFIYCFQLEYENKSLGKSFKVTRRASSSTPILSKMWLSLCKQWRDIASHRDLREPKETPETSDNSPDNFSGPESYFMSAMFTLKTQILLILKAEQQNSKLIKQVRLIRGLKTTPTYYRF